MYKFFAIAIIMCAVFLLITLGLAYADRFIPIKESNSDSELRYGALICGTLIVPIVPLSVFAFFHGIHQRGRKLSRIPFQLTLMALGVALIIVILGDLLKYGKLPIFEYNYGMQVALFQMLIWTPTVWLILASVMAIYHRWISRKVSTFGLSIGLLMSIIFSPIQVIVSPPLPGWIYTAIIFLWVVAVLGWELSLSLWLLSQSDHFTDDSKMVTTNSDAKANPLHLDRRRN